MEPEQLECRGASPPGSQDSHLCPVGRDSGYMWKWGRWGAPCLQVPPHVALCSRAWTSGYCECPRVQSAQSHVCAHTCARPQGTDHVSGSPLFACLLVCTGLDSRCSGEGRVLAHTSKQHHELSLPAYLKIATAEETRPHRALGEGWVESGRGMAQSPCSALSLSLHLPPGLSLGT